MKGKKSKNQDKINLAVRYINKELDKKEESQVLLWMKNDPHFAELVKRARGVKGLVENMEDGSSLNDWSVNTSVLNPEKKYQLKQLFNTIEEENKRKKKKTKTIFVGLMILACSVTLYSILIHINSDKHLTHIQQGKNTKIKKEDTKYEKPEGTENFKTFEDPKNIDAVHIIPSKDSIKQPQDTIQALNPPKEYPKNRSLERLMTANFRASEEAEIEINSIKQAYINDSLFVTLYFVYHVDSLSEVYHLEIENYKAEEIYTQKITTFLPPININIQVWENGYYYYKLNSEGEIPAVGHFLKETK